MIQRGDKFNILFEVKGNGEQIWDGPYECLFNLTHFGGGSYEDDEGNITSEEAYTETLIEYTDGTLDEFGEPACIGTINADQCVKIQPDPTEFTVGNIAVFMQDKFRVLGIQNSGTDTILIHKRQLDGTNSVYADHCRHATPVEQAEYYKEAQEKGPYIAVDGVTYFTFSKALDHSKNYFLLTRKAWANEDVYILMVSPNGEDKITSPYLCKKSESGQFVPWEPNQEDLFATDWYIT